MPPRNATPKAPATNGQAANGQADDAQKKKRTAMPAVLDISISSARCQSHMKATLTPAEVEVQLIEKRAALKVAKDAAKEADRALADDATVVALKKEIYAIGADVVRIGSDAPVAMATLADMVVKDVLEFAMDQTLAAEHKMVEVAAIHSGKPQNMKVWPVICNLPAISEYNPEHEAELRKERAAANKVQKLAREAKKAAKDGKEVTAEAKEAAEAVAAQKDAPADDDEQHGPATTFHTYVDNATKAVKADDKYKTMRVSHRLRDVVADLVAQLVSNLSLVAKVNVQDLLDVSTLKACHLQSTIKAIYVHAYGTEDNQGMKEVLAYIDEKVRRYKDHVQAEKQRRIDEMDPEKKAEIEAKKAEAAEAKKIRDAATAKEKAIKMAQHAKELASAVGK